MMFGTLPDLTPRDSHSLWYTSIRGPAQLPNTRDHLQDAGNSSAPTAHQTRQRATLLERTALSRLAADEAYLRHRKTNVQNFGSGWLKPPGVPKTLHQLREEKREQEEHAEAMRREQLAQELAEAEAGRMAEDDPEVMMDDDDDVQLDGAQDLDDEIPEAADADFGYRDDDDDDDDDEEESDDEGEITREERQNDLMAARMRLTDDAFREALVRGEPEGDGMYGGEEELEDEDREHFLDEEDLGPDDDQDDIGNMDADLDDDVPEADEGSYEHTDSEAGLSSSDVENDETRMDEEEDYNEEDEEEEDESHHGLDMSLAPRAGALRPPGSPTGALRGMQQYASRHSMDLSALLSQDESSFMESSPAQRAR